MIKHLQKVFFSSLLIFGFVPHSYSQHFTTPDYKKALWMTTRMYGGQRSGENNWMVHNHLPTGVPEALRGNCFIEDKDIDGYDLSGGWHDCGDHVKFGQTEFYSAYMLLKGYAEFKRGYDDYYSYAYNGYKTSGNWNWEGNGHDPNGIPDILDEVKHATDFFIKCAKNSSTFYYQVGQGGPDHEQWVTAVKMQTLSKSQGGQPRTVYKNPADASMASFCGATLALMSRMYRKFDPVYADLCLQHAVYAYNYAKANPGVAGTGDGGFYGANDNWKDDYATMCAELFWATGNTAYKTEALAFSIAHSPGMGADIYGKNYGFDYSNNGDIAIYNLALLGKSGAATVLNSIVNTHYLGNVQSDGQFNGGNTSWGPLRYNANTAFIVALWQKLNGTDNNVHAYIYNNIDYILGKNSENLSFIVGFGSKSPKFPHHRNIYLRDDNPGDAVKPTLTIPAKNAQAGILVGGTRSAGSFNDNLVNYQHTEGGIDYNACLVGILAYINSKLAPVDTNKFGHPVPDLGNDRTICGVSSVLLDSKIPVDGKKTFEWLRNGVSVVGPSTNATTYNATTAGEYTCILDSAGKWATQATVKVLGVLPDVNLGADKELCDPASFMLDINVTGSGISYEWRRDGAVIPNANSKTYTVYSPGTYRGTISASGCPSKSDDVVITSKLPTADHDTICSAGKVNLSVSGAGGPFEWYNTATGGSAVHTGTSYSPTISSSRTYYVRDASSLAVTAGPSSTGHGLSGPTNSGSVGINFAAEKAFTITEFKILPYVYSCNGENVTVTYELKQGSTTLATYTATGVPCTGVQSSAPFNTFYTMVFSTPINIPAPGDYQLMHSGGNQMVWFQFGANYSSLGATGIMNITGDTRSDQNNSWPAVFDIKIQAGSNCARTPVFAIIQPGHPSCTVLGSTDVRDAQAVIIYPNPSNDAFSISAKNANLVKLFDEMGREVLSFDPAKQSRFGEGLGSGIYHAIIYNDNKVLSQQNLVKQ
ncbi:MAG: glycoside hydrolase family 9 protein [Cytophagaceae bacterium]